MCEPLQSVLFKRSLHDFHDLPTVCTGQLVPLVPEHPKLTNHNRLVDPICGTTTVSASSSDMHVHLPLNQPAQSRMRSMRKRWRQWESPALAYLIEAHRITGVHRFLQIELHFVSSRGHRCKTTSTDGVVAAIQVAPVGEFLACRWKHRAPLSFTENRGLLRVSLPTAASPV
jgi:hypothetical protein